MKQPDSQPAGPDRVVERAVAQRLATSLAPTPGVKYGRRYLSPWHHDPQQLPDRYGWQEASVLRSRGAKARLGESTIERRKRQGVSKLRWTPWYRRRPIK